MQTMKVDVVSSNNIMEVDTTPMMSCSSSSSSLATSLPLDYVPGNWDVICQRGKDCHEHVGNRRFRVCVENHVEKYMTAKTRLDKSNVISSVVKSIKESASHGKGGFVMKDTKTDRWIHVDNKVARDKVGNALRDAMKQRSEFPNTTMLFEVPFSSPCETAPLSPPSSSMMMMPSRTNYNNKENGLGVSTSSSRNGFIPGASPRCPSLIDEYRRSVFPVEPYSRALPPFGSTSRTTPTMTTSSVATGIMGSFGQAKISSLDGDVVSSSGFQPHGGGGDQQGLFNSSDIMMFDLEPRPIEMFQ